MKKFVLMLIFILGSFTFGEITEQEVDSFFSPKTQVYISNQKDWFFGQYPDDFDGENTKWEKLNYFINVLLVGKKYKISYTPIDEVTSYDNQGYPVLTYTTTTQYVIKSRRNENIPTATSYSFNIMFGMMDPGTEIKNGKKYERDSYQVLSESELNALLKSKNAKRLDSTIEKNTKAWLDWLFHNTN